MGNLCARVYGLASTWGLTYDMSKVTKIKPQTRNAQIRTTVIGHLSLACFHGLAASHAWVLATSGLKATATATATPQAICDTYEPSRAAHDQAKRLATLHTRHGASTRNRTKRRAPTSAREATPRRAALCRTLGAVMCRRAPPCTSSTRACSGQLPCPILWIG